MTEIQSTRSAAADSGSSGLLDWIFSLLRRLTGTSASPVETEVDATEVVERSAPAESDNDDVIIAPGGYHIQRPGSAGATNSLENLLPDVRKGLDLLPPLPTVVMELLKEIQSTTSSAASVAQIAASDPSLAASLLRTVNSSAFGLPNKINSVPQAVSYLGFGNVRSLVVQLRLERLLPAASAELAVESEDLWAHALAVSYIASALAERVPDVDRGFISTLGLMHDIGRMAILSQFPQRAADLRGGKKVEGESRLEREARFFGADHTAIGAMLGNRWQLPADLTVAIRWHHEPSEAFEPTDPVSLRKSVYLIQIADQLAKCCFAYCREMEIDAPAEGAMELLGLNGSMAHLLDAKVRAAATQAILLADENSTRSPEVVRPFLEIRREKSAQDLTARLAQTPAETPRIDFGDKGDELIDGAKQSINFTTEQRKDFAVTENSLRLTAPASALGAKWLAESIAEQLERWSISPKLRAPARATLRALLPNLIETTDRLARENAIEAAIRWDGVNLSWAIRAGQLAFANRFGESADVNLCRRAVEVELANILNLGWFQIEVAPDGTTLLFGSN